MTEVSLSLTTEELGELCNALETHMHRLNQIYRGQPNPDWANRCRRLSALRTKLMNADIGAKAK